MKAMNYIQQRFLKTYLRDYALTGNTTSLDWAMELTFGCKLIKVDATSRHYGMQEDGTRLIIGTALNRDGRFAYFNKAQLLHKRKRSYKLDVEAVPVVHTVKSFKQYNMWYAVTENYGCVDANVFRAETEICLHLEPAINDMLAAGFNYTCGDYLEVCFEMFSQFHPQYDLVDLFKMFPSTEKFVDSLYLVACSARDTGYMLDLDVDHLGVNVKGEVIVVNPFRVAEYA